MPSTADISDLVAPFQGWLGHWEGEGRGLWEGVPPFRYHESLALEAVPERALIRLSQRTTAGDSTELSHSEVGYLRLLPQRQLELVVAVPSGYVEIHTGRLEGGVLVLSPHTLGVTPSARPLRVVLRRMELADGTLHNTVGIAVHDQEVAPHVESWLRRRG